MTTELQPVAPSGEERITPGLWYVKTDAAPGYTVVSVTRYAIGPDEGKLGVWLFDREGSCWIEDIGADRFICPVPALPDFALRAVEKANPRAIPAHFQAANMIELPHTPVPAPGDAVLDAAYDKGMRETAAKIILDSLEAEGFIVPGPGETPKIIELIAGHLVVPDSVSAEAVQIAPMTWTDYPSGGAKAHPYNIRPTYGQGPKPYMLAFGSTIIGHFDEVGPAKVAADEHNLAHIRKQLAGVSRVIALGTPSEDTTTLRPAATVAPKGRAS